MEYSLAAVNFINGLTDKGFFVINIWKVGDGITLESLSKIENSKS